MSRLLAAGVHGIELDVRRTADGVLIAHHDERLPSGRLIARCTRAEVAAAYPLRAQPASVEALIELGGAEAKTLIHLDLKEPGVEEETVRLALQAAPPERFVLTSLSPDQVKRLRATHPELTVGLSVNRSPRAFLRAVDRARRCGADRLAIHHVYLRTRLPVRAAAAGLELLVWTVDSDPLLARVVNQPSIATVITNRPLRALELQKSVARPTR